MGTLAILPEIILTLGGVLVMLAESARREGTRWASEAIACIAALLAVGAGLRQFRLPPADAYWGSIHADRFSSFFHVLLAAILFVSLLVAMDYFRSNAHRGEALALMLFAGAGMLFMTSAASLLLIFIGLEISSISSYILIGYRRQSATGPEGALKYFLLGSFGTAFFLYGIALAFGATGSDNLAVIGTLLALNPSSLAPLALALMLIGLGLKVSAAPFHVWTPDAYEAAPSPVTGFMSTGPKAAAFAVLLRVLLTAFPTLHLKWSVILWILAAASMTVGNFAALRQASIKRMLAYSSIAHAGYVLVALANGLAEGAAAAAFYLAAYAAMNIGAFAVLSYAAGADERAVTLTDFTGLARRAPFVAAVMTLFMLSLIGIPFTGGFFGKFYVFASALHAGYLWLAVVGLANSGIAAYYYLRVLVAMYMDAPDAGSALQLRPMTFGIASAIVMTAAATLLLGIVPGHVLDAARAAAHSLSVL